CCLVSVPEALDLSDQRLPPGGIEREVLDAVFEDRRIEQAGLDERADEGQVLVPSAASLDAARYCRSRHQAVGLVAEGW
ncbi:MAG: hypothetical protein M3137_08605, partial [Actinomycetota bacterium]|nr:hypothetical protein [Actinomycetota bacterium]